MEISVETRDNTKKIQMTRETMALYIVISTGRLPEGSGVL
jgi:hypothetical protein